MPLVYEELRKLAAQKLVQEKPGQSLQATALVHEAYLRLVDTGVKPLDWDGRGLYSLAGAVGILTGKLTPDPVECNLPELFAKLSAYDVDFLDVRGQEFAKRSLVVAGSGRA